MLESISYTSEQFSSKMADNEKDKWEEKGIRFETVTRDNLEECKSFMEANFFPDEPLCTTLLRGTSGSIRNEIKKMTLEEIVEYCIDEPHSLMALNKDNKIVGLRMGAIETPTSAAKSKQYNWMMWFKKLSFMVPHSFYKLALVFEFMKEGMEYNRPDLFTKHFPEASKIYEGHCVCVSREARGMKLGQELIQRTMKIAKDQDCDYTYILATGMYSQKIFKDLDFTVMKERKYEEFKYKNGDPLFVNINPHSVAQIVYFKMK